MTWTREHDKFLAEKAEGLTIRLLASDYFFNGTDTLQSGEIEPLWVRPYNIDIEAATRACQSWVKAAPPDRARSCRAEYRTTPGFYPATVELSEYGDNGLVFGSWRCDAGFESEARAVALYQALGGAA